MNTITLDIETDSINFLMPLLVGYAIKYNGNISYYSAEEINVHRAILEDSSYLKICHNLKFEYGFLKTLGIEMKPPFYDTQIACWLLGIGKKRIESNGQIKYSYGLKDLAEIHLGYKNLKKYKDLAKEYMISYQTGDFKKNGEPKIKKRPAISSEIPVDILSEYCKKDVEMTYKLYEYTYPKLKEQGLWNLFTKIEMPLVSLFEHMERNGVKIDAEYLEKYAGKLADDIIDTERKMNELVKPNTIT